MNKRKITAKHHGFIQIIPMILLAVAAISTFIIIGTVEKKQQDVRSRAEGVYPSSPTPTPTPKPSTPTPKPPTPTPNCKTGNCINDCVCRGNGSGECSAMCAPTSTPRPTTSTPKPPTPTPKPPTPVPIPYCTYSVQEHCACGCTPTTSGGTCKVCPTSTPIQHAMGATPTPPPIPYCTYSVQEHCFCGCTPTTSGGTCKVCPTSTPTPAQRLIGVTLTPTPIQHAIGGTPAECTGLTGLARSTCITAMKETGTSLQTAVVKTPVAQTGSPYKSDVQIAAVQKEFVGGAVGKQVECGTSGSISIGPGNEVFGCKADGSWENLTKKGVDTSYLTKNSRPEWVVGSLTAQLADTKAGTVPLDQQITVDKATAGVPSETPIASVVVPTLPPMKPCDTYPAGSVVIGPVRGNNELWECSLEGRWVECPTCLLTTIPSYLNTQSAYEDYLAKRTDIPESAQQAFKDSYKACAQAGSVSEASCVQKAIVDARSAQNDKALQAYAVAYENCKTAKRSNCETEAQTAAKDFGLSKVDSLTVAQQYAVYAAQKEQQEQRQKRFDDEFNPKLTDYISCDTQAACNQAYSAALQSCISIGGMTSAECATMVNNARQMKTQFEPAVAKYADCTPVTSQTCINQKKQAIDLCVKFGGEEAACTTQAENAYKFQNSYSPAVDQYMSCTDASRVCSSLRTTAINICVSMGSDITTCAKQIDDAKQRRTTYQNKYLPAIEKYMSCVPVYEDRRIVEDCVSERQTAISACTSTGSEEATCARQVDGEKLLQMTYQYKISPELGAYSDCLTTDKACQAASRLDAINVCTSAGISADQCKSVVDGQITTINSNNTPIQWLAGGTAGIQRACLEQGKSEADCRETDVLLKVKDTLYAGLTTEQKKQYDSLVVRSEQEFALQPILPNSTITQGQFQAYEDAQKAYDECNKVSGRGAGGACISQKQALTQALAGVSETDKPKLAALYKIPPQQLEAEYFARQKAYDDCIATWGWISSCNGKKATLNEVTSHPVFAPNATTIVADYKKTSSLIAPLQQLAAAQKAYDLMDCKPRLLGGIPNECVQALQRVKDLETQLASENTAYKNITGSYAITLTKTKNFVELTNFAPTVPLSERAAFIEIKKDYTNIFGQEKTNDLLLEINLGTKPTAASEKANKLVELKKDPLVATVLFFNNLSNGATKRGNDLLMSNYQNCTGKSLRSCEHSSTYSLGNVISGGVMQGAAPAAAVALVAGGIIAAPIIAGVGATAGALTTAGVSLAYLGTAYGAYNAVSTWQQTAEYCNEASIAKYGNNSMCTKAAIDSAAQMGLLFVGAAAGQAQMASTLATAKVTGTAAFSVAGQAVDATAKTVVNATTVRALNIASGVANTGYFGYKAYDACVNGVPIDEKGTLGKDPVSCGTNIGMAAISALRLGAAVMLPNTGQIAAKANTYTDIGDFGVNGTQAVLACASGDSVSCSNALAGLALSGGGLASGIGHLRAAEGGSTIAAYDAAEQDLRALYADPANPQKGRYAADVTDVQVKAAEQVFRSAIVVRGQEQGLIDLAKKPLAIPESERTLAQKNLFAAQEKYRLADTEYQKIANDPAAKAANEPIVKAYTDAGTELLSVKKAVDFEKTLVTAPKAPRDSAEYKAYTEALTAYEKVARVATPGDPEYIKALTLLDQTRQTAVEIGYTPQQIELNNALKPKQTEYNQALEKFAAAQEELAILSDPTQVKAIIDEAYEQVSKLRNDRAALGSGDVTWDAAAGKWVAADGSSAPDLVSGKYQYDSDARTWVATADNSEVSPTVVFQEQNRLATAQRSQLDTQIASLDNKIFDAFILDGTRGKAAKGDTAAKAYIQESQADALALQQQLSGIDQEVRVLTQARDEAGTTFGKIKNALGLGTTVEGVLTQAQAKQTKVAKQTKIDQAVAEEAARRGITDPAEIARLKANVEAAVEAKPTIRERMRDFIMGPPDEPNFLGKKFGGEEAKLGLKIKEVQNAYQEGSIEYRSKITDLSTTDSNGNKILKLGKISELETGADGSVRIKTGGTEVDVSRATKIKDVADALTGAKLKNGRYAFELNGEKVNILYKDGSVYFDSASETTLGGKTLRLPDGAVKTENRIGENVGLSPPQKKIVDQINTELAAYEKRLSELKEGKLAPKTKDPTTGDEVRKGKISSIRGIEAGERNQLKVIADAMLKSEGRGILFEALTGSGKSTVLIPEIAVLKAKITGKNVFTVLNTTGDLRSFIAEYVDIPAGKQLSDLSIDEIRTIEQKLSKALDEKVVILDGQNQRSANEVSEGKIFLTTKDVIFESIKGPESAAIMKKAKGAVLLADEAQLSLRLDIDYVISHGERVRLGSTTEGKRFIETFTKVTEESSVVKQALDLISEGEALSQTGLKTEGRVKIDEARKLLAIDSSGGERARIGNIDTENRMYADLLRQSADAVGDQSVKTYLDGDLFSPEKSQSSKAYQDKVTEFLSKRSIDGVESESLVKVIEEFQHRKTAAEAIVDQIGKVVGTDFVVKDGKVVLAEGRAISGRTPSRAYDALALEIIGGKLWGATEGVSVAVDKNAVSVTSSSMGTNYARFLQNFPEIYGFTGTPDYVRSQFETVYGINLGKSSVGQADFVLSNDAVHKVSTYRVAKGADDVGIAYSALTKTRKGSSNIEHVVIATGREPTSIIIEKLRAENPGADFITRSPNGDHYLIDANGRPTKIPDFASVDDVIVTYRSGGENSGKRLITVYEFGAHYGVDSVTKLTEPFTVIVGKDTTLTTFLQAVGRDRGTGGKYSQLDVIGLGIEGSKISNTESARTYFQSNEDALISRNQLAALKRVADNLGPATVDALEVAANKRLLGGASTAEQARISAFFEQMRAELRTLSEIDPNIGSSKIDARQDLLDSVNKVHRYLRGIESRPEFQTLPDSVKQEYKKLVNTNQESYSEADLTGPGNSKDFVALNNLRTLDDFVDTVRKAIDPDILNQKVARGGAPQAYDLTGRAGRPSGPTLSSDGTAPSASVGIGTREGAITAGQEVIRSWQDPTAVHTSVARTQVLTGLVAARAAAAAAQENLTQAQAALTALPKQEKQYQVSALPGATFQIGDAVGTMNIESVGQPLLVFSRDGSFLAQHPVGTTSLDFAKDVSYVIAPKDYEVTDTKTITKADVITAGGVEVTKDTQVTRQELVDPTAASEIQVERNAAQQAAIETQQNNDALETALRDDVAARLGNALSTADVPVTAVQAIVNYETVVSDVITSMSEAETQNISDPSVMDQNPAVQPARDTAVAALDTYKTTNALTFDANTVLNDVSHPVMSAVIAAAKTQGTAPTTTKVTLKTPAVQRGVQAVGNWFKNAGNRIGQAIKNAQGKTIWRNVVAAGNKAFEFVYTLTNKIPVYRNIANIVPFSIVQPPQGQSRLQRIIRGFWYSSVPQTGKYLVSRAINPLFLVYDVARVQQYVARNPKQIPALILASIPIAIGSGFSLWIVSKLLSAPLLSSLFVLSPWTSLVGGGVTEVLLTSVLDVFIFPLVFNVGFGLTNWIPKIFKQPTIQTIITEAQKPTTAEPVAPATITLRVGNTIVVTNNKGEKVPMTLDTGDIISEYENEKDIFSSSSQTLMSTIQSITVQPGRFLKIFKFGDAPDVFYSVPADEIRPMPASAVSAAVPVQPEVAPAASVVEPIAPVVSAEALHIQTLTQTYQDAQLEVQTLTEQVNDAQAIVANYEQTIKQTDDIKQQLATVQKQINDAQARIDQFNKQIEQYQSQEKAITGQIRDLQKANATGETIVTEQQQAAQAQKILEQITGELNKKIDDAVRQEASIINQQKGIDEATAKLRVVQVIQRQIASYNYASTANKLLSGYPEFANDTEGATNYSSDIASLINSEWFIARHMSSSRFTTSTTEDTATKRNSVAIGDVHGDWKALVRLLSGQTANENGKRVAKPLVDKNGNWIGGSTDTLLLMGDLFDRSPTGVLSAQTAERIMQLQRQAGNLPDGTPRVKVLLGNHDVNAIYAYWHMNQMVRASPRQNKMSIAEEAADTGMKPGISPADLLYLYEHPDLARWMMNLDAMMVQADKLYMHSDTMFYTSFGSTISEVNNKVKSILTQGDLDEIRSLVRKLTNRYAFVTPIYQFDEAKQKDIIVGYEFTQENDQNIRIMLKTYGVNQLIHSHSENTPSPGDIKGNIGDTRVINIDGGLSESYAKKAGKGVNRGRFFTQNIPGEQKTSIAITPGVPQGVNLKVSARPLSTMITALVSASEETKNQLAKLQADLNTVREQITAGNINIQTTQSSLSNLIAIKSDLEKQVLAIGAVDIDAARLAAKTAQGKLAEAQALLAKAKELKDFFDTVIQQGLQITPFDAVGKITTLGERLGNLIVEGIKQSEFTDISGIERVRKILIDAVPSVGFIQKLYEAGDVNNRVQKALDDASHVLEVQQQRGANIIAEIQTLLKEPALSGVVLSDSLDELTLEELQTLLTELQTQLEVTSKVEEPVLPPAPPAPTVTTDTAHVLYAEKIQIIPDTHGKNPKDYGVDENSNNIVSLGDIIDPTSLKGGALTRFRTDAELATSGWTDAQQQTHKMQRETAYQGVRESVRIWTTLLEHDQATLILGNHEAMMLGGLLGNSLDADIALANWLFNNGGGGTLTAIGITGLPFNSPIGTVADLRQYFADNPTIYSKFQASFKLIREQVLANAELMRFIHAVQGKARLYTVADDVLLVHAGIPTDTDGTLVTPIVRVNGVQATAPETQGKVGLDALDVIETLIHTGNVDILVALANGSSSDPGATWIRDPFFAVMRDDAKAANAISQLDAQAQKRGGHIKNIVIGHTDTAGIAGTVIGKYVLAADTDAKAQVVTLQVQKYNKTVQVTASHNFGVKQIQYSLSDTLDAIKNAQTAKKTPEPIEPAPPDEQVPFGFVANPYPGAGKKFIPLAWSSIPPVEEQESSINTQSDADARLKTLEQYLRTNTNPINKDLTEQDIQDELAQARITYTLGPVEAIFEKPLVEAGTLLRSKNIDTVFSGASGKSWPETNLGFRGTTLTEENKQLLLQRGATTLSNYRGAPYTVYMVSVDATNKTPQQIEEEYVALANALKSQQLPIPSGVVDQKALQDAILKVQAAFDELRTKGITALPEVFFTRATDMAALARTVTQRLLGVVRTHQQEQTLLNHISDSILSGTGLGAIFPAVDEVQPLQKVLDEIQKAVEALNKTISLSTILPPIYGEALKVIPVDAPKAFKDSARRAAYFFWALEEGKTVVDENGNSLVEEMNRMRQQLRDSGYIGWAYIRKQQDVLLPKWMREIPSSYRPTATNVLPLIEQQYKQFVTERAKELTGGEKEQRDRFGDYSYYEQGIYPVTDDKQFVQTTKAYIEVSTELASNLAERLKVFSDKLREASLHFHSAKLFDGDRVVMYWLADLDDQTLKQIQDIAIEAQVLLRGPAQDPSWYVLTSDGKYRNTNVSNDGALGDSGANRITWEQQYDSQQFFMRYLQMILWGGKRPDHPYLQSMIKVELQDDVMVLSDEQKIMLGRLSRANTLPIYVFGKNSQLVTEARKIIAEEEAKKPQPAAADEQKNVMVAWTDTSLTDLYKNKNGKIEVTLPDNVNVLDITPVILRSHITNIENRAVDEREIAVVYNRLRKSITLVLGTYQEVEAYDTRIDQDTRLTGHTHPHGRARDVNQQPYDYAVETLKQFVDTNVNSHVPELNFQLATETVPSYLDLANMMINFDAFTTQFTEYISSPIGTMKMTWSKGDKNIQDVKRNFTALLKELEPNQNSWQFVQGLFTKLANLGFNFTFISIDQQIENLSRQYVEKAKLSIVIEPIVEPQPPAPGAGVVQPVQKPEPQAAERGAAPVEQAKSIPECVTGDTLLKRRKRRKKKGVVEEYWEDVRIDEIKPGDEIRTFDETTGTFVQSRVNKLLAKGVQPVIELVTSSGKTIKTTSKHPYFIHRREKVEHGKRRIAIFVDDANMFYAQRREGWKVSWEKLLKALSQSGDVVYAWYYIGMPKGKGGMRNRAIIADRKLAGFRVVTKPVKIIVDQGNGDTFWKCNFDVEMARDVTTLILQKKITDIVIVSGDSDFVGLYDFALQNKVKLTMACFYHNMAWEFRSKPRMYLEDIRGIVEEKKSPARGEGEVTLPILAYERLTVNSGNWKEASTVNVGDRIAVSGADGRPRWDTVMSVRNLPRTKVYDIEVAGTHTFLGNGIVAHNTAVREPTPVAAPQKSQAEQVAELEAKFERILSSLTESVKKKGNWVTAEDRVTLINAYIQELRNIREEEPGVEEHTIFGDQVSIAVDLGMYLRFVDDINRRYEEIQQSGITLSDFPNTVISAREVGAAFAAYLRAFTKQFTVEQLKADAKLQMKLSGVASAYGTYLAALSKIIEVPQSVTNALNALNTLIKDSKKPFDSAQGTPSDPTVAFLYMLDSLKGRNGQITILITRGANDKVAQSYSVKKTTQAFSQLKEDLLPLLAQLTPEDRVSVFFTDDSGEDLGGTFVVTAGGVIAENNLEVLSFGKVEHPAVDPSMAQEAYAREMDLQLRLLQARANWEDQEKMQTELDAWLKNISGLQKLLPAPVEQPPGVTAEEIVSIAKQGVILDEKFTEAYFDALADVGKATKNKDGSYKINPAGIGTNQWAVDHQFLAYAQAVNPDLKYPINTYQSAIISRTSIAPAQQQVFINRLLDPKSPIFFTVSGTPSSFEGYLQSVYGKTVRIIRVEQSRLDPVSEQSVFNTLQKELSPSSYAEMSTWMKDIPVTKVVIEKDGREITVPIITADIGEDGSNAVAIPMPDSAFHPVIINTNIQSRSLFDILRTVSHETDHAVRRLSNPVTFTSSGDDGRWAVADALINYFYKTDADDPYRSDDVRALMDIYHKNSSAVFTQQLDEMSQMNTLIGEMGGELASMRLLDAMITGFSRFGKDGAEFVSLFSVEQYLSIIDRASSVSEERLIPYAVGNVLGDAIGASKGMDEVLRIIHELPLPDATKLLKPAVNATKLYLEQQLPVTQRLYDLRYETKPKTVSIATFVHDAEQTSAKKTEVGKSLADQVAEQLLAFPEKADLIRQITLIIPAQPLKFVTVADAASEMIRYLSTKNMSMEQYVHMHQRDITETATSQAISELMPHVDTLFTIFGQGLALPSADAQKLKEFILTTAVERTRERLNKQKDIQTAYMQLSELLSRYGYDVDTKFSQFTGQSFAIPTMTDSQGIERIDTEQFMQLQQRIRLEALMFPLLGLQGIQVDLTDNPSLDAEYERFKNAFSIHAIPFPFASLDDALKASQSEFLPAGEKQSQMVASLLAGNIDEAVKMAVEDGVAASGRIVDVIDPETAEVYPGVLQSLEPIITVYLTRAYAQNVDSKTISATIKQFSDTFEQYGLSKKPAQQSGLVSGGILPAQWFENLANATIYKWLPETRTRGILPVLFDIVRDGLIQFWKSLARQQGGVRITIPGGKAQYASQYDIPLNGTQFFFNPGHTSGLETDFPDLLQPDDHVEIGDEGARQTASVVSVARLQAYLQTHPEAKETIRYYIEQELRQYDFASIAYTVDRHIQLGKFDIAKEFLASALRDIPFVRMLLTSARSLLTEDMMISSMKDILSTLEKYTTKEYEAQLQMRLEEIKK